MARSSKELSFSGLLGGILCCTWKIYCHTVTLHRMRYGYWIYGQRPPMEFKMIFHEIPEVYLRLMKSGYSRRFCLSMILRNLRSSNSWRILFGGLRRWPIFATRGFIYYVSGIVIATTRLFGSNGRQELLEEVAALN